MRHRKPRVVRECTDSGLAHLDAVRSETLGAIISTPNGIFDARMPSRSGDLVWRMLNDKRRFA